MFDRSGASASMWHASAALWAAAAAVLLLAPNPGMPEWAPWGDFDWAPRLDWLGHAALFATGASLLGRSFAGAGIRRPLMGAVLVVVAYGLGLELLQRFVPGRVFELADGLANAAGAGVYGVLRWRRG